MTIRGLAVVLSLSALLLTGCGTSQSHSDTSDTSITSHDEHMSPAVVETDTTAEDSEFRGRQVDPRTEAPALGLKSHEGRMVRVEDLRGKVVMVSFLFTQCPDICPVIVQKLRYAQTKLGAQAKDTRIVVVSVDPKGDTPDAVRTFLEKRQMTGRVDWLLGSDAQLRSVWKQWGIAAEPSVTDPNVIQHSGVVWLVDPVGRRAVYYPLSSIDPDNIAQDVTRLLETGATN